MKIKPVTAADAYKNAASALGAVLRTISGSHEVMPGGAMFRLQALWNDLETMAMAEASMAAAPAPLPVLEGYQGIRVMTVPADWLPEGGFVMLPGRASGFKLPGAPPNEAIAVIPDNVCGLCLSHRHCSSEMPGSMGEARCSRPRGHAGRHCDGAHSWKETT